MGPFSVYGRRITVSIELTEVYRPGFPFAEAVVDHEQRVIRHVSLLGRQSLNGRLYSQRAMSEAAELHKGVGIFVDHPSRSEARDNGGVRSFRDLTGRVLTASVHGDRVKGDIQVLEGPEGDKLLAVAEHMPGVAGFSHRAHGEVKPSEDGLSVVETISKVDGADIVTDPATVNGLFESLHSKGDEDPMEWTDINLADLKEHRPDLLEAVESELSDSAESEALKAELKKTKDELDRLQAQQTEREHKAMVERKLAEAELPKRLVTEHFVTQLRAAEDEKAVDALIEDRLEIARTTSASGPKSTGRDFDEAAGGDEDHKPVTGDVLAEAYDRLTA